jgi:hypothetical protein
MVWECSREQYAVRSRQSLGPESGAEWDSEQLSQAEASRTKIDRKAEFAE